MQSRFLSVLPFFLLLSSMIFFIRITSYIRVTIHHLDFYFSSFHNLIALPCVFRATFRPYGVGMSRETTLGGCPDPRNVTRAPYVRRKNTRTTTLWLIELRYGTMYGVKRTTIYLPEELKRQLELTARAESRTEADIIREALAEALGARIPPRPQLPVFAPTGRETDWAERADELLEGFGR